MEEHPSCRRPKTRLCCYKSVILLLHWKVSFFKIPRVGSTAPTDSIAVRGLPLLTNTGVFLRFGSDRRGLIREQFSLSLNLLKRDNRLTLDALLGLPLLTPLGASTSSRLLLGWSSGS